ncbi:GTPase-GDP dissociation stimulator Bem4p [Monosporozyma servazzii]
MDYEDILFGLQPILNATSIKDVPIQDVYLQSYITVMDQLAVSLRAPQNRDLVRETGLLTQILRVLEDTLDVAIHEPENIDNLKYWQLASELIRCVANCLVDNNTNRKLILKISESSPIPTKVSKNPLVDYYMTKILTYIKYTNENEDIMRAVQLRSIVLLRNLVLENSEYAIRIAKTILGPLLTYLKYSEHTFQEEPDNMVLALDLLLDVTKEISTGYSLDTLLFLTRFCKRIATVVESIPQENDNDNDGPTVGEEPPEEDPYSEMLFSLSECIEVVVSQQDNGINFASKEISTIQNELLTTLSVLKDKFFANKLIMMRRLVSIAGNISAIPTNSNINDRPICYQVIRDSQDGYTIAAALIILSNSINSRDDVSAVLKEITLDDVINVAQYIKDPLGFQGYLDILQKLMNLSNSMFLSHETVATLFYIVSKCSEQAQFFPSLSELIDKLLKKAITVLPSNSLFALIDQPNENNAMVNFITKRGSFVSCLLLDKLLVAKKETSPDTLIPLWDSIFKFSDSADNLGGQISGTQNISVPLLFQLTKTIGIYLKNCVNTPLGGNEPNIIFTKYFEPMTEMIRVIIPLRSNTDKGSESIYNNGRFIAGMIHKLLSTVDVKTPEEQTLNELADTFFNDD